MTPAVALRIANARANFNGTIEVVEDRGDTALVMVTPSEWDPFADTDADEAGEGDWGRMTRPFLMLIDPAYVDRKDGVRQ